jgi:dsRNA-specific ribonuclease
MTDYKTMLQEKTQLMFKMRPKYKRVFSKTPNKIAMEVWCKTRKIGFGVGENNKDAEFNAAKNAYQFLTKK